MKHLTNNAAVCPSTNCVGSACFSTRRQGAAHRERRQRPQVHVKAASGDVDVASISRQLGELAEKVRDERFWASQQPHYGTAAAKRLLQTASEALPGVSLPSMTLPQLPQLPTLPQHVDLPAFQLPAAPHLPEVNIPDISARLDMRNLQEAAAGLAQAGQRGMDSAAAYASSLASSSGSLGPSLTGLEPHYGTRAAQHAAESLLTWLQGQAIGPASLGSLGGAVSREFRDGMAALAGVLAEWGDRATSAPAGVLATISGTVSTLPRLLVGDTIAAFHIAGDTLTHWSHTGVGGYSSPTVACIALGVLALGLATAPKEDAEDEPGVDTPLPWEYDADAVANYWARRPVAVAQRTAEVLSTAALVGAGLLYDRLTGGLRTNAPLRAAQVRAAIERLGPAYVKVAQAVSTRVDMLSPAYLLEIERLQDRVPPFPTSEALVTMAAAWQQAPLAVLSAISPEPIAAASLGQVYRATLAPQYGGGEVAVKVQRPALRRAIALDLFLMRRTAIIVRSIPEISTDWVGLIDEWATRFFQELDYEREARNAAVFRDQMASLGGITVAEVYENLTSREVLTTAWVQGEKLSESTAADVRELCSTLLNCYLIQLLETGLLHADPHPGNLLRTADGRICILDFGLMTEVAPERRLALVEYIAHLSVQDWAGVARDLVNLGFTPEGAPDPGEAGLVEPLGAVLMELSKGGGAKGINIDDVTAQLERLTQEYPFQIPSYFALILRAFSVIEGIALRVDPDYSIVQECFPYIARRLLTDNHPRTRAALQQLLYANKSRIDIGRLQRLSTAFGRYTVSGLTVTNLPAGVTNRGSSLTAGGPAVPVLDSTAKEALKVVFSRDGSYAQEVLVEELVAAVDSLQRYAVSGGLSTLLDSLPATISRSAISALGPWRPLLLPLPTPLELLSRLVPAVQPTAEDEEVLESVRAIARMLQAQGAGVPLLSGDARSIADLARQLSVLARQLAPLVPELAPGIGYTGELFVRSLLRRMAERMRVTDRNLTGQPRIAGYTGTANPSLQPSAAGQNVSTVPPQPAMGSGGNGVDASYTAYGPGVVVLKNGAYSGNGKPKVLVPQPVMRQL
ncbi:g6841 [Coccomyxa elongata]